MCKDTNQHELDLNRYDDDDNKTKMFGKAKMNQDPKMNAVGLNDVSKLLEMKDQQMQLNEFNKDYCKATIDMLDE